MTAPKNVSSVHAPHAPHMVGDGLPVRNFFSYSDLGAELLSPFLMLDYGSPVQFPPTESILGVGMHPHRGFETVTLVLQGGLQHRDTAGNEGTIGSGDVQWMTAGSGVLHEEMHSSEFRKRGGILQMLQLWVNLPAHLKMTAPRYQTLTKQSIPDLTFDNGRATVRVIAGTLEQTTGPAQTFTPINLWDVRMQPASRVSLSVPDGHTTALALIEGEITVNNAMTVQSERLIVLDRSGTEFQVNTSSSASRFVVMAGQPITGPVVGYGPFVMNSREQIHQAIDDFQNGRFSAIQ